MIDYKKVGNFIAQKRRQQSLTQKELAKMLYVSDKAISRWETGESLPDISLLKTLADLFEVSIEELLGYGDTKTSATKNTLLNNELVIDNKIKNHNTSSLLLKITSLILIGLFAGLLFVKQFQFDNNGFNFMNLLSFSGGYSFQYLSQFIIILAFLVLVINSFSLWLHFTSKSKLKFVALITNLAFTLLNLVALLLLFNNVAILSLFEVNTLLKYLEIATISLCLLVVLINLLIHLKLIKFNKEKINEN